MRFLAAAVLVTALLTSPAVADPARDDRETRRRENAGADRVRVGAETHWSPQAFGRRIGVGLGWCVPQRWYDADGSLLTERSLLAPDRDLERPGLYLALPF